MTLGVRVSLGPSSLWDLNAEVQESVLQVPTFVFLKILQRLKYAPRIVMLYDFRGIKKEENAGTENSLQLLFIGELLPISQTHLCEENQSV